MAFVVACSAQAQLVLEFGQQGAGLGDSTDNTEYGITGVNSHLISLNGDGTDTFTSGNLSVGSVTFDLTVSSANGSNMTDANEGIGIASGNFNTIDPADAGGMLFTISNVSGLGVGQTVGITGITTWFATADNGTNGEGYRINGGTAVEVPLAATGNGFFVDTSSIGSSPLTVEAVQFGAQVSQFQINDVRFDVVAVPEPATIALLGLGMGTLLMLRTRRFSNK